MDVISEQVMFANYPNIVSVQQLMQMLQIGRSAAYNLLQSGEIPSFQIGNVYKIPKRGVIDYTVRQTGKIPA